MKNKTTKPVTSMKFQASFIILFTYLSHAAVPPLNPPEDLIERFADFFSLKNFSFTMSYFNLEGIPAKDAFQFRIFMWMTRIMAIRLTLSSLNRELIRLLLELKN